MTGEHDDPAVFRALADPSRRRLLDLLLDEDGRTVGELADEFQDEMTRFGVMKHLRVLEEAGLVVPRREGRATRHYLNPVPIRRIARRWMDRFRERAADALLDLAAELEGIVSDVPDLSRQVYQVFIRATPERIWEALTTPEVSARYFHGARISVTAERYLSLGPGDEVWGDAPVEVFEPPHRLVHGWKSKYDPELDAEPMSRVSFEITPDDPRPGICRLVVVHDRLDESPLTAENVSGRGWMYVLSGLKSYLETGEPLVA